jgi:type IV pilus assembly protein PilZ
MVEQKSQKKGILSLSIKEKKTLYAAYMPFITDGGLFIPTVKDYQMGEEIFILLSLLGEPERVPIAGKVIWKTPEGAEGYRQAGVGLQFSNQDGGSAQNKIESLLAGALNSGRSTHTM